MQQQRQAQTRQRMLPQQYSGGIPPGMMPNGVTQMQFNAMGTNGQAAYIQFTNSLGPNDLIAQQFQKSTSQARSLTAYQANLAQKQQSQMPGAKGTMPNQGGPQQGSPISVNSTLGSLSFGALQPLSLSKIPVEPRLDLFMKTTISQDLTTSEACRQKSRLCAFESRPLLISEREERSKTPRYYTNHPISPPISAGGVDIKSDSPAVQSLVMMASGQRAPQQSMSSGVPMADSSGWNPAVIFE